MIIKEERIGGQRLILGDCREIIGGLAFDAICTDPPYGIGESGNKNKSRGKLAAPRDYGDYKWDSARPDLSQLPDVPKIIWGGNYFDLGPAPRWLVWDKQNGCNDFADGEMAWCSNAGAMRLFRWQWNGFIRKGEMDKTNTPTFRVHPTQKPVALMEWCLGFLPNAKTILDPFMGSGTTLVACQRMGRAGTGIELDPDYFQTACKRVDEATRQPDMFVAPAVSPIQEAMPI